MEIKNALWVLHIRSSVLDYHRTEPLRTEFGRMVAMSLAPRTFSYISKYLLFSWLQTSPLLSPQTHRFNSCLRRASFCERPGKRNICRRHFCRCCVSQVHVHIYCINYHRVITEPYLEKFSYPFHFRFVNFSFSAHKSLASSTFISYLFHPAAFSTIAAHLFPSLCNAFIIY